MRKLVVAVIVLLALFSLFRAYSQELQGKASPLPPRAVVMDGCRAYLP